MNANGYNHSNAEHSSFTMDFMALYSWPADIADPGKRRICEKRNRNTGKISEKPQNVSE